MSAERIALVKRIKKLLSLGTRNPNPNESAAALAKAQELMAQHHVTELELACIVERESSARIARRPPIWQTRLGAQICAAFGVERFIDRAADGRTIFRFVGAEYRIEIAVYAFNVLARQARSATRNFMAEQKARKASKRARIAEDYSFGFIHSACKLLTKIAPPSEAEAAAIAKYMERHELVPVKPKSGAKMGAAALCGILDGSGAVLNHGTTGSAHGQIGSTFNLIEASS